MKFPVNSVLAGNSGSSETGSLVTPSSSRESVANHRKRPHPRVSAVRRAGVTLDPSGESRFWAHTAASPGEKAAAINRRCRAERGIVENRQVFPHG